MIKDLLTTSKKIKDEQKILVTLASEMEITLNKSFNSEAIEKEYEKKKGEQLIVQNAVNNKLIMLVNERIRIKDSISMEVASLKNLKEQMKEVSEEISLKKAAIAKQKEIMNEVKERIIQKKEKLEKIDFGTKVKVLSWLNNEIDKEVANAKIIEQVLESLKYGLRSSGKIRENEEAVDRIIQGMNVGGDSEMEVLMGDSGVIQKRIKNCIDQSNKLASRIETKAKEYMGKAIADRNVISKTQVCGREINKDWLYKTQI